MTERSNEDRRMMDITNLVATSTEDVGRKDGSEDRQTNSTESQTGGTGTANSQRLLEPPEALCSSVTSENEEQGGLSGRCKTFKLKSRP
jgi:hypothetical protein